MEWLAQNWFWVVIGVLFVGMHLFGHGGHGGGGGHSGHGGGGCGHGGHDASDKPGSGETGPDKAGSKKSTGHQH
mgnify:CR=1 FL=1